MAWYYAGGKRMNHLARVASASNIVATPTADALFPLGNLYDGRVGTSFKFGSASATPKVEADKNMVVAGNCDTLTGWTTAGSPTTVAAQYGRSGTQIKLTTPSDIVYQDVLVRAGELLNLTFTVAGDGTAAMNVKMILLEPNLFFDGAAWTTNTILVTRSTASFATSNYLNGAVLIPNFTTIGGPMATLRLYFYQTGTGACYMDDVYLWPSTNFIGLFSHSVPLAAPVVVVSDDDTAFGSTTAVGTITPYTPACGLRLVSMNHERAWRITATVGAGGFNITPSIGEYLLTQVVPFNRNPDSPYEMKWKDAGQIRYEGRAGAKWVTSVVPSPPREISLTFSHRSVADQTETEQNFRSWAGGAYPVLVLPDFGPIEMQLPILGTVGQESSIRWPGGLTTYSANEFTIEEEPAALVS